MKNNHDKSRRRPVRGSGAALVLRESPPRKSRSFGGCFVRRMLSRSAFRQASGKLPFRNCAENSMR